jgi:very-short-patch-repair endonuclease
MRARMEETPSSSRRAEGEGTDAENKLWFRLRARRLAGAKFPASIAWGRISQTSVACGAGW